MGEVDWLGALSFGFVRSVVAREDPRAPPYPEPSFKRVRGLPLLS